MAKNCFFCFLFSRKFDSNLLLLFRTVVRRTRRHQFIDPDYAYDPQEAEAVRQHRNSYGAQLKASLERRRLAKRDRSLQKFENGLDMGMVPGSGANGHRLTQDDVQPDPPREFETWN